MTVVRMRTTLLLLRGKIQNCETKFSVPRYLIILNSFQSQQFVYYFGI